MDMNTYQGLAMKTRSSFATQENMILNVALGLTGESGEVADLVKKHIFQGHELNKTKIVEEIGDILWYCAEAADALGIELDLIARGNIAKLEKRYPEGFSVDKSLNREEYK